MKKKKNVISTTIVLYHYIHYIYTLNTNFCVLFVHCVQYMKMTYNPNRKKMFMYLGYTFYNGVKENIIHFWATKDKTTTVNIYNTDLDIYVYVWYIVFGIQLLFV